MVALVADLVGQRPEHVPHEPQQLGVEGAHLDARRWLQPPRERPSLVLHVGDGHAAASVGVDRVHELLDELRGHERPPQSDALLGADRPHVQHLLWH